MLTGFRSYFRTRQSFALLTSIALFSLLVVSSDIENKARAQEAGPSSNLEWAEEDLGTAEGYTHEIVDERSRFSRTYRKDDGTNESVIYESPINFRNDVDEWQAIDNTLVPSDRPGYAYENSANNYKVFFPEDLSTDPVRIENEGEWITYSLEGAQGSPTASGSTVTYDSALPNVDLSYSAGPAQVEEFVTLESPSAQQTFSFDVDTSDAATLSEKPDGGITVNDGSASPNFVLEPAFMFEATETGSVSDDVKPVSLNADGDTTVELDASSAWLDQPDRDWPVMIDPTTTFNTTGADDCYITSFTPNESHCWKTSIRVGTNGSTHNRSLLRFPVEGTLDKGDLVSDAYLELRVLTDGDGQAIEIDAHGVEENRPWTNSATWNKYNGTNTWTTSGGDWTSTASSENAGYNEGVFETWSEGPYDRIDELVQGWGNDRLTNQGIILKKASGEPDGIVYFASSNDTDNLWKRPKLHVTWEDVFVSYTANSFFQDALPANLDDSLTDPSSGLYLNYLENQTASDKKWPLLKGLGTSDDGIASVVSAPTVSQEWDFAFAENFPDDPDLVDEPAIDDLLTNGFRAPLHFADAVNAVAQNGDAGVVVFDRTTGNQFDLWGANCSADTSGSTPELTSAVNRPGYFEHSSNGLHRLNGYSDSTKNFRSRGAIPAAMPIRADEIRAGKIAHVLHMYWPETDSTKECVHPMVGFETSKDGEAPEGIRIRIKAEAKLAAEDLDTLAQLEQGAGLTFNEYVIAKALQDYGAYLGDNAGGEDKAVLKTQQDYELPSGKMLWDGVGLDENGLNGLSWNYFEFIDAGYQGEISPDPEQDDCPPDP